MAKKNATSVYIYTSVCCKGPAVKPACEHNKDDRKEGKHSTSSLGTWRCTHCKKKCAVTRSKRPVEQAQEAA